MYSTMYTYAYMFTANSRATTKISENRNVTDMLRNITNMQHPQQTNRNVKDLIIFIIY